MSFALRFIGAAAIGYSIRPELLPFITCMVGLIVFSMGIAMDANAQKGDTKDVNSND
jgi:hypothetical protein